MAVGALESGGGATMGGEVAISRETYSPWCEDSEGNQGGNPACILSAYEANPTGNICGPCGFSGAGLVLGPPSWSLKGSTIEGSVASEKIGRSVSLSYDGDVVAIGATNLGNGQASVYKWLSNAWQAYGSPIDGSPGGDQFGASVSLGGSGDVLAVGAPGSDDFASDAGAVFLYAMQGDPPAWVQQFSGFGVQGDEFGLRCVKIGRPPHPITPTHTYTPTCLRVYLYLR